MEKERAREGEQRGGETREFYARATILAGEFHMPTPLMSLKISGRLGSRPAGCGWRCRGMLLNFVEYLSHFHTPFRWLGPFVSYRTAGARFGSPNRDRRGTAKSG